MNKNIHILNIHDDYRHFHTVEDKINTPPTLRQIGNRKKPTNKIVHWTKEKLIRRNRERNENKKKNKIHHTNTQSMCSHLEKVYRKIKEKTQHTFLFWSLQLRKLHLTITIRMDWREHRVHDKNEKNPFDRVDCMFLLLLLHFFYLFCMFWHCPSNIF